MYYASKRSKEKMFHKEHCRYAKMISPKNRIMFTDPDKAFAAGKIACPYCSTIMQRLFREYAALSEICLSHGISLIFNQMDGTLEITTPESAWKVALQKERGKYYLYHKNYRNYDNGGCPYKGYHYQRVWFWTIENHIDYIVRHDKYTQNLAKEKEREMRELERRRKEAYMIDQISALANDEVFCAWKSLEKMQRSKRRLAENRHREYEDVYV